MKKIKFSCGWNHYDFFIVPTVRVTNNSGLYTFLTIEWLKWYIGFSW